MKERKKKGSSSDFLALGLSLLLQRAVEVVFVHALVVPFDFLDDGLHLFHLSIPFLLAHLGLALEELDVGRSIAPSETVPERCELPVVPGEV